MYEQANEKINEGLSLGARLMLGSISGLFGLIMIMVAPDNDKAIFHYLFGAFCLLITLACCTQGRVRQFIGSIIGATIFVLGLAYLVSEIAAAEFGYRGRSQPSVLSALGYVFFIGIPGAAYAFKARFGFGQRRNSHVGDKSEQDPI